MAEVFVGAVEFYPRDDSWFCGFSDSFGTQYAMVMLEDSSRYTSYLINPGDREFILGKDAIGFQLDDGTFRINVLLEGGYTLAAFGVNEAKSIEVANAFIRGYPRPSMARMKLLSDGSCPTPSKLLPASQLISSFKQVAFGGPTRYTFDDGTVLDTCEIYSENAEFIVRVWNQPGDWTEARPALLENGWSLVAGQPRMAELTNLDYGVVRFWVLSRTRGVIWVSAFFAAPSQFRKGIIMNRTLEDQRPRALKIAKHLAGL